MKQKSKILLSLASALASAGLDGLLQKPSRYYAQSCLYLAALDDEIARAQSAGGGQDQDQADLSPRRESMEERYQWHLQRCHGYSIAKMKEEIGACERRLEELKRGAAGETRYQYLRTGPENGWNMSKELYAKCPLCGYYMNMDAAQDETCPCGNLYKDAGAGRFGAQSGDMSIELYAMKQ